MALNFNDYVYTVGTAQAPLRVMLASRHDRGNIWPTVTVHPVVVGRDANFYQVDLDQTCFRNVTKNSMSTPLPLSVTVRAAEDFRRVASPHWGDVLNLTHENLNAVRDLYTSSSPRSWNDIYNLLCIRP